MSELPKGWRGTLLNGVVDKIVGGGTPSKSVPSYYEGDIPWMTVKDMNKSYLTDTIDHITQEAIDNSSTNVIPAGTPIIATRMSLGKIVRASFDSAINQDLKALFVNREVDDYYFEYWYRSQGLKIESLGTGTTVKGVRLEVINALEFPLAPLAEQKRIVEKLDEVLTQVDTIKARLDGIPALLKRFRQSVLASAVSGQLTEEWRGEQDVYPTLNELKATIDQERFEIWCSVELNKKIAKGKPPANDKWKEKYQPANPKYNDSNKRTAVEGIRAPWLVTSIDAVSILTTGKTPSTSKDEYWNGDTMFVSPAQIHPEGYLHNPSRYVSEEGCQVVPLISKGSTLIVCIGTVGKVGLLTEDVVINQQINAITPLPSVVHKYMYYWCKTLYPWIIDTARATVNAAILNKSTMSTAPFALPPLEEQEEIVRLVDQYFAFADTIEVQVKKAQARVDNLSQSILAKAFRGELVPQDPNDEPADNLLERIAQARKEAEALAKAAKKAEATKKKAAKSA